MQTMSDTLRTTSSGTSDGTATGSVAFTRYQLKRVLGRGGMGVVWLATDTKLERPVALKFLPEIISSDPHAVRDLKDETRRGLELAHPHIVRVYDFLDDEGASAISMEFVDGKTLAELRLQQPRKTFTVDQIRPWVVQICDALEYAHTQRRLVHRDLKPANVMVDINGEVKITDFGIARSVADTVSRLTRVHAGTSGTLLYMRPQQTMGDRPRATDDIYSVGATIYELLTSKPPFYSGDVTTQVLHKAVPPMKERRMDLELDLADEIPPEWESAIVACLDKDPGKRPQSASALLGMLGLTSATPLSNPITTSSRPAPTQSSTSITQSGLPGAKHPKALLLGVAAAAALAFVAMAAGMAWWWLHRTGECSLATDPDGSLVTMEGVPPQPSPAIFRELKPGHYEAKITHEGYEPQSMGFDLARGQRLHFTDIRLEKSTGTLLLYSEPQGARYEVRSLDGALEKALSGETPKSLRLPVGNYKVRVVYHGEYRSADPKITRNGELTQSFQFAPASKPATEPVAIAPSLPTEVVLRPGLPSINSNANESPKVATAYQAGASLQPSLPGSPAPPSPVASPDQPVSSVAPSLPNLADIPASGGSAAKPSLPAISSGVGPSLPGLSQASLPGSNPKGPVAALNPPGLTSVSLPGATPNGVPTAGPSASSPAETAALGIPGMQSAGAAPAAPSGPIGEPSTGFWNLDELFANSGYKDYSPNGRHYVLFRTQQTLKAKGQYQSTLDGREGKGTHKAIEAFQSFSQLPPNGQLDTPTLEALALNDIPDKKDWETPTQQPHHGGGGGGGGGKKNDSSWIERNLGDPLKKLWKH